ncbi:hypothetical protein D3C74_291830 [compost metagenome]
MSVQIMINGENATQAIEEFATLSAAFVGQAPITAVTEEPKPRQRRAASITKKDEPTPESQVENTGTDESEQNEGVEIPSVVELRAKAQEVGQDAKKKPKIKELLNKYDSPNISEVPEDKRAAFMAELEDL